MSPVAGGVMAEWRLERTAQPQPPWHMPTREAPAPRERGPARVHRTCDSTPGRPAVAGAWCGQGLRVGMVGQATATLVRGFLCRGAKAVERDMHARRQLAEIRRADAHCWLQRRHDLGKQQRSFGCRLANVRMGPRRGDQHEHRHADHGPERYLQYAVERVAERAQCRGADEDEAKSGRGVGGQQHRSKGANQRAEDRTNKAVDRRLQRPTDAVLGNDDGRQHGPVAMGQTEGSGQGIGERGRNHHAQDEPEADVVGGEHDLQKGHRLHNC